MAHKLLVYLFNEHVGTLGSTNGRLSFQYTPEFLQNPNGASLSCSLPLQIELFDDQLTRPFFAGPLPEDQMRRLIAQ